MGDLELHGDVFEFRHKGLIGHAVPFAGPAAVVDEGCIPDGRVEEHMFARIGEVVGELVGSGDGADEGGVDEPVDVGVGVVDGVGVEPGGAVVVEVHPLLVGARAVHVEVGLDDVLVVAQKLEVDLILGGGALAGGDVEAREQAARVALGALDGCGESPSGVRVQAPHAAAAPELVERDVHPIAVRMGCDVRWAVVDHERADGDRHCAVRVEFLLRRGVPLPDA